MLNAHDVDKLLESRFAAEHSAAGRADVAPGDAACGSVTARRLEEAAELVPAA